MQKTTLKLMSAALAVLLAAPAFAQEATPPAASGLSTGEPVAAATGPQLGEPYVQETFGDWALRCVNTGEENDPCHLYQLLEDEEANPVAEISIFALPAGQEASAGATIIAPLETMLQAGVVLEVDGQNARRYPFAFCGMAGCVSRIGLTTAELDQLRAGSAGRVTIVPAFSNAENPEVNLTVSLAGFTAGYRAIEALPPTEAPAE
ncbi:invasion associated locus B family protein [Ketogulonicigenium vulgare]|uniref:Invasion associated family protein n=1 Tax=Ketogulonicigenium vulgare (strain WSH-001) TaxID=759362 RepID=F9Y3R1_KETVW|nr:invasion associated locus B family protein [Ketogulonicigenium vulgare]ADO42223.1 invasion associated locus B family protein [Ketogulonicigenium vulgare Y25]AEM40425.1 Invasion associated family protein [Ketogulonicigenium vulgare WSH-001]ALJ80614.1 invasion associated locus B family protein [Ketogulonicigenium vulgare]ANW33431.1 invasion associated locus B family protein [Ketogulonicigenium vulgare]AOZ54140.1 invasion associated locus B family protein [Ketogulonicigenium vulgare]